MTDGIITKHKICYGTMFHEISQFETNKEIMGKVFSFEIDSRGLGFSDRSVKRTSWNGMIA